MQSDVDPVNGFQSALITLVHTIPSDALSKKLVEKLLVEKLEKAKIRISKIFLPSIFLPLFQEIVANVTS
jgi:hypothetical protein